MNDDANQADGDPTLEELMGRLRGIQLYQVRMDFPEPVTDPIAAFGPFLREHVLWLRDHERDGSLFLSGANQDETGWDGGGTAILRATSRATAVEIAESEPFHREGIRVNTVLGWLMNEGHLKITLGLFDDRYTIE